MKGKRMNVEFRLMLYSVVCGQLISFDVQYVLVRGIPFYVFESNEMYYGCFFSSSRKWESNTHRERTREEYSEPIYQCLLLFSSYDIEYFGRTQHNIHTHTNFRRSPLWIFKFVISKRSVCRFVVWSGLAIHQPLLSYVKINFHLTKVNLLYTWAFLV